MKTSHATAPSNNNNFYPRKSRRPRALPNSSRHTMPPNNQNDNTPNPTPSNPSTQYPSNAWNHNHIRAIAEVVAKAKTTDPAKLFPASSPNLPDALNGKTRDEVIAVVENLLKAFDKSIVPFAQEKNPENFLAVLASEINFLKKHRAKCEAALAQLQKARAERKQVERSRQRLVAESKALNEQIELERARRKAAIERKPKDEANLEAEKRDLEQHRQENDTLRETLEEARLAELDVRRQLDRMRLKIAAMRGEMIIPTIDKLSSRSTPKWLGDFDDSLISGESEPRLSKESDATMETPPKPKPKKENDNKKPPDPEEDDEIKPDVEMEPVVPTEDIESQDQDQSVNDDLEFDESNEETEFRLLKNRLAMVEMEAEEWKQCVEYQRQQVRMITRSKVRLEEELARQKHGSGSKATGGGSGRGAGKSGSSSAKATARLRATIRASLPPAPDTSVRKPIRKSRKGRPKRALLPELE